MYNYNGTDIETSLKGDDMKNVDIEEVREALIEARDGCSEVQSKTSDMNESAFEASSYADDADNASFDALERVKAAIDLLDSLAGDQEEGIDPDAVRIFLNTQLKAANTMRDRVFSYAREWDIKLEGE